MVFILPGIMDSKAKCWKESMFGGASTRSTLYPWEELFRGNIAKLSNNWKAYYFQLVSLVLYANF